MPPRQSATAASTAPVPRPGREAQRRRTRAAIVTATTDLVRTGATPTIDEIAAAADVSRRTVYMHFPSLDQLLLDATVGAMSTDTVDSALAEAGVDPTNRVDALVHALTSTAEQTLPLGRKIIALTVDAPESGDAPRRGYRRAGWVDTALEPLRGHVTDEQYDRLAAGLSVLIGWEAMVILRDVRGLDPHREDDVLRWAAASLVTAILAEK